MSTVRVSFADGDFGVPLSRYALCRDAIFELGFAAAHGDRLVQRVRAMRGLVVALVDPDDPPSAPAYELSLHDITAVVDTLEEVGVAEAFFPPFEEASRTQALDAFQDTLSESDS